ncbi:hypothetical protein BJX64DRAFT_284094 [Aspergillus heterothallicus]
MPFQTKALPPIVVGIDFGTTATGVSFAKPTIFPSGTRYLAPGVYKNWPSERSVGKIPSRIAYPDENSDRGMAVTDSPAWGSAVRPGMHAYTWTKLLLDATAPITPYDDKDALLVAGVLGVFRTSPRPAECAVADYLRNIYQYIPRILNVNPDYFREAGFYSRPQDHVQYMTESEAAVWAAVQDPNLRIQPYEGVLVCDIGGGTLDVAAFTVINHANPETWRRTIPVQAVDIRFHQLMADRFGEVFLSIDQSLKGPGSYFSKDFEQNKRAFTHQERRSDPMRLTMNVATSERYKAGKVFVTHADLKACFKPVVERIEIFVETQLESARQACDLQISKIVLVGGLAESLYVQSEMQSHFRRRGIDVIVPAEPRLAVARGAAFHGIFNRSNRPLAGN